jgi:hypothetical protein
MQNISGFGLTINLVASKTFPVGLILTEFADDADPFDLPSLQIADDAMGLNGDLIAWSKPNPIKVSISAIPQSFTDLNLAVLFEANRVGRGKQGARDIITMTGIYPNGSIILLTNGIITDGLPGNAVASAGRMKSKTYQFAFENKVAGI